MKFLIVLATILASACAISFFDLVLEEWGTYKVRFFFCLPSTWLCHLTDPCL